jgi:hypothetical protein
MAHTLCTGASLSRYAALLHPLPIYDSHALPHYGFSDIIKWARWGFQLLIWISAYQLFSPTQGHALERTLADLQGLGPCAVSPGLAAGPVGRKANPSSKDRQIRVTRRQDIRKGMFIKTRAFRKYTDTAWVKNRHYFLAVF